MTFQKIRASQFDIDGNIFNLPMELDVEVDEHGTGEFTRVMASAHDRVRRTKTGVVTRELPHTFDRQMRDEAWHEDVATMLAKKDFGPAEPSMREWLLHAQEISFNTARGHSPEAIAEGIKKYILETFDTSDERYFLQEAVSQGIAVQSKRFDKVLEKYFAERLHVYPIFSSWFDKDFGLAYRELDVRQRKQMAYRNYVYYLRGKYGEKTLITLGFSDDTAENLAAIKETSAIHFLHEPLYANLYQVFYLTKHPNTIEKTWLKTKMEVIKTLTDKQV